MDKAMTDMRDHIKRIIQGRQHRDNNAEAERATNAIMALFAGSSEAEYETAPNASPDTLAWARAEAEKLEAREAAMRGVVEAAQAASVNALDMGFVTEIATVRAEALWKALDAFYKVEGYRHERARPDSLV